MDWQQQVLDELESAQAQVTALMVNADTGEAMINLDMAKPVVSASASGLTPTMASQEPSMRSSQNRDSLLTNKKRNKKTRKISKCIFRVFYYGN